MAVWSRGEHTSGQSRECAAAGMGRWGEMGRPLAGETHRVGCRCVGEQLRWATTNVCVKPKAVTDCAEPSAQGKRGPLFKQQKRGYQRHCAARLVFFLSQSLSAHLVLFICSLMLLSLRHGALSGGVETPTGPRDPAHYSCICVWGPPTTTFGLPPTSGPRAFSTGRYQPMAN